MQLREEMKSVAFDILGERTNASFVEVADMNSFMLHLTLWRALASVMVFAARWPRGAGLHAVVASSNEYLLHNSDTHVVVVSPTEHLLHNSDTTLPSASLERAFHHPRPFHSLLFLSSKWNFASAPPTYNTCS